MGIVSESAWYRQSWPKCVGQSAFFPNCCNIRSLPLPPRCNVGRLVGKPFLTNNIAWREGEEGKIWPKERLFPCEKLIDGRGSAFCKLVPHNFGQDCSLNHHFQHCAHSVYQSLSVLKLFEIAVCLAPSAFYEISSPVIRTMLTMVDIVWIIISNISHTVYIRFTVFSNFSK